MTEKPCGICGAGPSRLVHTDPLWGINTKEHGYMDHHAYVPAATVKGEVE